MPHAAHDVFSPGGRILLAGDDSLAGANLCAAAAVDAGVRIDFVDIALGDRLGGTYGHTSATSYTVVGNYVSHDR